MINIKRENELEESVPAEEKVAIKLEDDASVSHSTSNRVSKPVKRAKNRQYHNHRRHQDRSSERILLSLLENFSRQPRQYRAKERHVEEQRQLILVLTPEEREKRNELKEKTKAADKALEISIAQERAAEAALAEFDAAHEQHWY